MLLLALACRYAPDAPPVTPDSAEITDVSATPSAFMPNIFVVRWTSSVAGSSQVEFGVGTATDRSTPLSAAPTTDHAVTVLGLPVDGGDVTFVPVTLDAEGRRIEGPAVTRTIEPLETPPIELLTTIGDPAVSGYVLFNLVGIDQSSIFIIDREGTPVWYAQGGADQLSTSSYLSADRTAILFNSYDEDMLTGGGTIERVALDGSTWSTIPTPFQHHDFAELPGGYYAYLAAQPQEWDGVQVLGDQVRVVSKDTEPTVVFDPWEWLTPYAMCLHYRPVPYGEWSTDWLHVNSVRYVEADDSFRIMSRNLDAIFAVDRQTGDLKWQMGGADSDFAFLDGETWDHAHYSDLWDGGMTVYDNGLHRDPPDSRVVEYAVDEVARTVEAVWSTEPRGPTESLGDIRKLDDGTYLIAWAEDGTITQTSREGEVLWEARSPGDLRIGHVSLIEDLYAP